MLWSLKKRSNTRVDLPVSTQRTGYALRHVSAVLCYDLRCLTVCQDALQKPKSILFLHGAVGFQPIAEHFMGIPMSTNRRVHIRQLPQLLTCFIQTDLYAGCALAAQISASSLAAASIYESLWCVCLK